MGFQEDFAKFRAPKEATSSDTQLPSFQQVREGLKKIEATPKVQATPVQQTFQDNLAKLRQELSNNTSISAPTGNETPVTDSTRILQDNSAVQPTFKLSDLILPEIRKGFQESFGKAAPSMSSDIYTEMIPSFGKSRAYEIADAYQHGVDATGYPKGITLTPAEKNQFDGWKQKHWALITLDAADLLGVGEAIKGAIGFVSRTGLREAVSTAVKLDNVKDIHEALLKQLPQLKDTQELSHITDIVVASREQNPDKLAQIIQKRVQDPNLSPADTFSTSAQKIVYENGVPVLRKTTPDTLLQRRADTLEAIKGNSEALRLSNSDILSQEIKAGSLPIKTTAEDTIPVWRVAAQGRRIKNGEEVSLTEQFANSLSEGAKVQKIEVPVSDLIRLPDGSFTFAPERLIKEAPVLKFPKNISAEVVDATKQKEADIIAKKLAKQQAEQEAKRVAQQAAERELQRPVEEAKAKMKALEEKASNIKVGTQKLIIKEQNTVVKNIAGVKKVTFKQVGEINKNLRKAKQAESLIHTKKMSSTVTKLQKQKERIRYANKIAKLNEKAKIEKLKLSLSERKSLMEMKGKSKETISSFRKDMRDNLKSAHKEIRNAKNESVAVNKTVEVSNPKTKSVVETINDIAKNSLKNTENGVRDKSLQFLRNNPSEITKGEVRLRQIEDGSIVIEDGRHRLQVASELGIKPKIVDVTAEYTGKVSSKIAKLIDEIPAKTSTVKRTKESLKPVGEGAVKESKLYESTQARVREVRKDLGDSINSKEYEFYRTASNKDQLAKASAYIEANGIEETIKTLEVALRTGGDAAPGILNNSLLLALEPELLKSGMAKYADNLLRLSSRLSTRMGQELQILSVLDRNNPLSVLARLNNEVNKIVNGSGILGATAKKGSRVNAEKELETLTKAVDTKSNIQEVVDAIEIC